VNVRGKGTKGAKGAGIYPIVARTGRSGNWAPHSLTVDLPAGEKMLRLRFINDDAPAPEDRNLWLERMEVERLD